MVDSVQSSPSVGKKNYSETAAPRRPEKAVTSTAPGTGAAYGAPSAPESKSPEPKSIESGSAQGSRPSPAESALDHQNKLNNLTLSVRKAVANGPSTLELVRESVGQFIDQSNPVPSGGGSGEAYVPEIDMPGSGDFEPIQPGPAPEVPKTAPPPAAEQDSGEGGTDGPRGEVLDVVS